MLTFVPYTTLIDPRNPVQTWFHNCTRMQPASPMFSWMISSWKAPSNWPPIHRTEVAYDGIESVRSHVSPIICLPHSQHPSRCLLMIRQNDSFVKSFVLNIFTPGSAMRIYSRRFSWHLRNNHRHSNVIWMGLVSLNKFPELVEGRMSNIAQKITV